MIEKQNYDMLIQTVPTFKSLIENLTAKKFEVHQARIFSDISESAEERYNNFIKSYPSNQRVPLHMVASFLGLSRETLSRIRKHALGIIPIEYLKPACFSFSPRKTHIVVVLL